MNKASVDYVKSVKNSIGELPKGDDILSEGIKMGQEIQEGKSLFLEESGYETYAAYKQDCLEKGIVTWEILLGLATLDEQVAAIKEIYDYSQRTGLEIHTVQMIPSQLLTLPKAYRENAPKPTSYMMEKPEDWIAHQAGVPMQMLFEDQHLSCPNSLETTINAVKAGSARVGLISQFIWGQPGFTDDKQHMIDMLKSIGIVASKKDKFFICDTYLDDGFPGYAMDCVTYVGYALLEHYIVHDLCGARYQVSWGGLLSEGKTRLGVGLAIHKLLTTKEQPALSYINGSTVMQWDHDIDANYGPSDQEMLLEALCEKKFKMGLTINPVSITEKVTVPTLKELLNIFSSGSRALERASDWEDMMDWSPLEKVADDLAREGKRFFENALAVLKAAGVNTSDPLEMFMVLKKINPSKFEMLFHPGVSEEGILTPLYPTVLGRDTMKLQEKVMDELYEKGIKNDELAGRKIVIASGDGHAYGLQLVNGVLSTVGAEVISGGVDIDAPTLLDLADEEEVDTIGISVHNGQGLDYAKLLADLAAKRGRHYKFFMGGKLNAILPGETEPCDVADKIKELGVLATNDLFETIAMIKK